MTRQTRFSRPVRRDGDVNTQPFEARRATIAVGPVFIGQHNPGAHYAPVANIIVEPEQLYQPRRRG